MSGGLVFPSLSEFSTVYCDPHSKGFGIVNKAEIDVFLGDRIPVELCQILKDDAVKVLHSICQQIWKTAVATGLEKVSFHSNPKERQCQRIDRKSTRLNSSHRGSSRMPSSA